MFKTPDMVQWWLDRYGWDILVFKKCFKWLDHFSHISHIGSCAFSAACVWITWDQPFNNHHLSTTYTINTSFSLSIMTKTSIVPGCEGSEGREQGKCISKTLTVGENRALILMCVWRLEKGVPPPLQEIIRLCTAPQEC